MNVSMDSVISTVFQVASEVGHGASEAAGHGGGHGGGILGSWVFWLAVALAIMSLVGLCTGHRPHHDD